VIFSNDEAGQYIVIFGCPMEEHQHSWFSVWEN
jgi:hypothetical protein